MTIPALAASQGAAGLDLDFGAGLYRIQGAGYAGFVATAGVAFARSGAGLGFTTGDAAASFGSGVPRITDRGLLLEGARTNRFAGYNANPVDLTGYFGSAVASAYVSVVDDAAAIAAAGLGGVATSGKVVRVANTGASNAFLNVYASTGTAQQTISAYVRSEPPTTLAVSAGSGASVSVGSTTTAYTRFAATQEAVVGGGAFLRVSPGQTVFVTLIQVEEGATASSPIVTTGAATTRGADSATVTVPPGCTTWTATHGGGATATGATTPGAVFDLIAGRPWLNGYLQRLVIQ